MHYMSWVYPCCALVGHLMIILVDNVTLNCEEDSEVVVKTMKGIEKDVTELLKCVFVISFGNCQFIYLFFC